MTDATGDQKIADLSFEQALSALEQVVQKLEDGSVPLEQSIDLYTRGEALREVCEARLKDAELKVTQIQKNRDGAASGETPF